MSYTPGRRTERGDMRESKYRVVMDFGSERVNVETVGVKDPDTFLDFIETLGAVFPRYLVDFFNENVKEESQEKFLVDFLMWFVREYLDVTGLSMRHLADYVLGDRDASSSTVH